MKWHRNTAGVVKIDNESDDDTTDLMSNAELNEHLNVRSFVQTGIQSH